MKTFLLKLFIIFSVVFFIVSCSDPIFYIVHNEIPVLKPLIDGSPTNFTEYNGKLYVASGRQIYSYDGNKWSKWNKLGGRITGLAATAAPGSLYALYLSNDNEGRIKNLNSGSDENLSGNVQSIYANGNILFACVRNGDNYTISFKEEGNSGFNTISTEKNDSILNGVASNSAYIYLCVNSVIYYTDDLTFSSALLSFNADIGDGFTGIINLSNDFVAAISNNGKLYEIKDTTIREAVRFSNDNRSSTGALAVWYNGTDANPSLLLAGRKENYYTATTGYSNGYLEIRLDTTTGGISGSSFSEPGKSSPTSIAGSKYDSYVSSLGKKPINHIIQAPASIDPANMTLFVSTQQNGVWSYRTRNGEWQWNSEQ